jgi:hypothetical protein
VSRASYPMLRDINDRTVIKRQEPVDFGTPREVSGTVLDFTHDLSAESNPEDCDNVNAF